MFCDYFFVIIKGFDLLCSHQGKTAFCGYSSANVPTSIPWGWPSEVSASFFFLLHVVLTLIYPKNNIDICLLSVIFVIFAINYTYNNNERAYFSLG